MQAHHTPDKHTIFQHLRPPTGVVVGVPSSQLVLDAGLPSAPHRADSSSARRLARHARGEGAGGQQPGLEERRGEERSRPISGCLVGRG